MLKYSRYMWLTRLVIWRWAMILKDSYTTSFEYKNRAVLNDTELNANLIVIKFVWSSIISV